MQAEQHSYYSIITHDILFHPSLSSNAKILYCVLTGLARGHGYAWPTDDYLAEVLNTCKTQIKEWLNELEEAEVIERETFNEGLKRKRRIWVARDKFKKVIQRSDSRPIERSDSRPMHESDSRPSVLIYTNKINEQDNIMSRVPPAPVASADAEQLAEDLFSSIKKTKEDFRPPNLKVWAKEFDLILRIDKRSPEQLKKIIEWLPTSDFWKKNILSPSKLRKQFDRLEIEMDAGKENDFMRQNTAFVFAVKKENAAILKHIVIQGGFVLNLSNGKDLSLKMNPQRFTDLFLEVAGVERA